MSTIRICKSVLHGKPASLQDNLLGRGEILIGLRWGDQKSILNIDLRRFLSHNGTKMSQAPTEDYVCAASNPVQTLRLPPDGLSLGRVLHGALADRLPVDESTARPTAGGRFPILAMRCCAAESVTPFITSAPCLWLT
jgi:hypothetical protein